ncbi:hypothetical protein [Flexithrix dorotheae]|uniref:hypothetical protein n=1 Tax=Flexithrix dorotheae TaxID=70993 RepID=UPI00036DE072|nr:hypothetical protein [Flexithrix dorotheae]
MSVDFFKNHQYDSALISLLADKILNELNKKSDSSLKLDEKEEEYLKEALQLIEPFPTRISLGKEKCSLNFHHSKTSPIYRKSKNKESFVFSFKALFIDFYNWMTGKYSITTAIFIIFFFTTHQQFFEPIIDLVIKSFFRPLQNSYLFFWLTLFSLLLLILYWIRLIVDKVIFNKGYALLSIILILPYIYYRCFSDTYLFFPIKDNSAIYFADIILVHLLGFIINKVINLLMKKDLIIGDIQKHYQKYWILKEKKTPLNTPLLLEDSPIEDITKDRFNRSRFISELANRIVSTKTETSFAISIRDVLV